MDVGISEEEVKNDFQVSNLEGWMDMTAFTEMRNTEWESVADNKFNRKSCNMRHYFSTCEIMCLSSCSDL